MRVRPSSFTRAMHEQQHVVQPQQPMQQQLRLACTHVRPCSTLVTLSPRVPLHLARNSSRFTMFQLCVLSERIRLLSCEQATAISQVTFAFVAFLFSVCPCVWLIAALFFFCFVCVFCECIFASHFFQVHRSIWQPCMHVAWWWPPLCPQRRRRFGFRVRAREH